LKAKKEAPCLSFIEVDVLAKLSKIEVSCAYDHGTVPCYGEVVFAFWAIRLAKLGIKSL
jgi:hypothetical protein